MGWRNITDNAPRDGRPVRVRQDGYPPYVAKYWTVEALAEEEWDEAPHGWYEYSRETDDDGWELVNPTEWWDASDDTTKVTRSAVD